MMNLLGRRRSAAFADSVCSFEDPLAPLSPLLSLQVGLVIIAPLFLLTLPFDVALFLVLAPYLLAPHRLVPGELRCIAVRQRMLQIAGKDASAIVAIISQPRPLKLASGAVVFRPDDTQAWVVAVVQAIHHIARDVADLLPAHRAAPRRAICARRSRVFSICGALNLSSS